MASGSDAVDVRAVRAVQGTVAVATLSAFVFHQPWVIPVLGVFVGAGALMGPLGNPIYRIFDGLIAPRVVCSTMYPLRCKVWNSSWATA